MARFIYKCILLVVLTVKIIRCYDCNQFYRYSKENNYALFTVPTPENHNNYIKLNVLLQYASENFSRKTWNENILFVGTIKDVLQHLPLTFKLNYVILYNVLPKIISISINNNNLCVSEKLATGLVPITTVNLTSVVQVGTYGNDGNNNSNLNRKPLVPESHTKPSRTANQHNQRNLENKMSRNNDNRRSGQSLLNTCGKTSKMSEMHLIANGRDAQVIDHPWIGAMFLRKKEELSIPMFLCGASLITNKYALTAGHCVVPHIKNDIFVSFGRTLVNDWLDENSQLAKVAKSEIHPDYNDYTADADIAVLQFNKEITFTASVQPVCLWDTSSLLEDIVDKSAVVVGWGKDEKYEFPQHLKELYLRIASEGSCLRAAEEFFQITSNRTFCAGNRDGSGPCYGDSGSGLYLYVRNRWFIRGIVSKSLNDSSKRCDFFQYAVFLDVAKHMQWIRKFI